MPFLRRPLFWAAVGLLTLLLIGCDAGERAPVETAISQAGGTAIAKSREIAATKAAELKETAVAELAKKATELAQSPTSPWEVSWLPADSQAVVRIDEILQDTGLAGQGSVILQYAREYVVNPAFALAMLEKEATFAKPGSRAYRNKNPGNIIATGDCREVPANSSCDGHYGETSTDGRFGVYASMEDGLKAYFMLLSAEYRPGTRRNCSDIDCIITAYCPPSDCDTPTYISQVTEWTRQYQEQILVPYHE